MYCYDEKGELLGVISCIPKEGEEHLWGDTAYVCTGEVTTNKGCKENGMIFNKVTYKIYCKLCEELIGDSVSDDNGFAVCLECYEK